MAIAVWLGAVGPAKLGAQSWLNDDFAQRKTLTGTFVEDWAEAIFGSAEPGEPLIYEYTLWWSWTAPTNGRVKFQFEGHTDFRFLQGEFAVYTGRELSGLSVVTNRYLSSTDSVSEAAWFEATAGTTYLICVGADWFLSFHFSLLLGTPPPNDDFAHRIHLGAGDHRVQSPAGLPTRESFEPGVPNFGSLWWSWTAPRDGPATVLVEGTPREGNDGDPSPFRPDLWCDASAVVYAGETLAELWPVPVEEEVQRFDPQFAQAHFQATAGRTYQLQVSYRQLSDCATLSIASTVPPRVELISPTNGQEFAGSVRMEAFAVDPEGSLAHVDFSVGPNYGISNPVVRLKSPPYVVRRNLPAGEYWIQAQAVDGHGMRALSDRVRIRVRSINDQFAARPALTGARVQVEIPDDLRLATTEPDEPAIPGVELGGSLWWSWSAPTSGAYTVSVPIDRGLVAVYRGNSLGGLTPVGTSLRTGYVTFSATAGETFALSVYGDDRGAAFEITPGIPPRVIMVQPAAGAHLFMGTRQTIEAAAEDDDGRIERVDFYGSRWFWNVGEYEWIGSVTNPPYALSVDLTIEGYGSWRAMATDDDGHRSFTEIVTAWLSYPSPPNDDFERRIELAGSTVTAAGTLRGATVDPGQPDAGNFSSIWWSWVAPSSGRWTVTTSNADTIMVAVGIYTGDSISNLTEVALDSSQVSFEAIAGVSYAIAASTPSILWDIPPSISINLRPGGPTAMRLTTAPALPAHFRGDRVTIKAEVAGGPMDDLKRVDFFQGERLIASRTEPPYAVEIVVTEATVHGGFSAVAVNRGEFVFRTEPLFLSVRPDNDSIGRRSLLTGAPVGASALPGAATWEPGEPDQRRFVWWSWTAVTGGVYTVIALNAGGYPMTTAIFDARRLPELVPVQEAEFVVDRTVLRTVAAGREYLVGVVAERSFSLRIYPGRTPSIRLIAPGADSVFPLGASVLAAPLITHDAPVQFVDYYAHDQWLGRVSVAPYSFEFTPKGSGTFALVAQATDAVGLSSRSEATLFHVTEAPPVNDAFALRQPLAGVAASTSQLLSGASLEPGEPPLVPPLNAGRFNGSVWWSWTPMRSGPAAVRVTTTYGAFGSLQMFTGASLSTLKLVAGQFGGSGPSGRLAELRLMVSKGTEYQIRWAEPYPGYALRLSIWQDFLELDELVRLEDGRWTARYRAGWDRSWRVEQSPDLFHWSPLGVVPSVDGIMTWIDPGAGADRRRFYRVEPWP